MKTFTKNYKSLRVWLWFVSKITKNNYRPRLLAEFIETQKRYPNFLNKISNLTLTLSRRRPLSYRNQYFRLERVKTICHIKPKQTFLVNLTLWKIIPCETSHICRCDLKIIEKQTLSTLKNWNFVFYTFLFSKMMHSNKRLINRLKI